MKLTNEIKRTRVVMGGEKCRLMVWNQESVATRRVNMAVGLGVNTGTKDCQARYQVNSFY